MKSTRMVVDEPTQMVSFPVIDMVAVGTGLTTIFLLPDTVPTQASSTLNKVYVVVVAGLTFTTKGLDEVVPEILGPVELLIT